MAASRQWINLQKQLFPQAKETTSVNDSYTKNALRRQRETIEAAVKRGHLKQLNKDLILDSQLRAEGCAAAFDLEHVQRISLGRCHVHALDDFDLLSCVRLRICNLESCYLDDITAFYGCVNLLKLDLTDNQITVLPPQDFWSSLSSLRVLYLSDNAISGKSNLTHLNGCPQLHILTLHNTPLSFITNYRHHVVNSIMSLRALDSHVISDEEIIENLHLEDPFTPLSEPFKLPLYQSYPVGTLLRDELKGVYHLLLRVDRVMARYSPVILIQRWTRGWLTRRQLIKTNNPKIMALLGKRLGTAARDAVMKGAIEFSKRQALPSSSQQLSPRKTKITAQVPTTNTSSSRSRLPRRRRKTTTVSPTPPAPPTTPRRRRHHTFSHSIETHVLGVDKETSQLKCTMHIDLKRLQHSVALAEQSEPEGVNKMFKRAFIMAKRRNGSAKKSEFEAESSTNVVTTTGASKEFAAPKSDDAAGLKQNEKDEKKNIELAGEMAKVLTHDQLPDLATTRREDGRALRAAEREICQNFAKIRQPPPQPVRELRPPKVAGKEHHAFTRAYATMTLSALRSIEKVHEARRKGEQLVQKANLVSRIKQERVIRRSKIEEFHRSLRESALEWKTDETHRLEEARIKQKEQQQVEILKRSQAHDSAIVNMQKLLEDQEFSSEFGRQNTLVGSTLSKEDRKISRDSAQSETKERVQLAREISAEQQQLVKKYMETRKTKLIREGVERKNELDIKLLESVTKRLMDAKRKVAKENARKEAARVAIAEVKRDLRYGPRGPGEQRPAARGGAVRTESDQDVRLRREEHLEAFAKKQSEYTSPAHVRRMTHESHKTWQRGAEAIEEEEAKVRKGSHHFPIIPASSRSAIMYDMMAPGSILTSQGGSPLTSSSTHHTDGGNSATDSMLISKYQVVR